jgi:hypothetical protein
VEDTYKHTHTTPTHPHPRHHTCLTYRATKSSVSFVLSIGAEPDIGTAETVPEKNTPPTMCGKTAERRRGKCCNVSSSSSFTRPIHAFIHAFQFYQSFPFLALVLLLACILQQCGPRQQAGEDGVVYTHTQEIQKCC